MVPGSLVSSTRRSSPPAPTPNAWHAPKQAGATHAAPQDMGEAIVLQLPGEGLEILDLLLHLMGRHQPPIRLEISVRSGSHSV